MDVNYKIEKNGKPKLHISRNESATIFDRLRKSKFNYNKSNLFISEIKINNPKYKDERKFVISIRLDGINQEYKMSQMALNENELIELRNNINKILNFNKSLDK